MNCFLVLAYLTIFQALQTMRTAWFIGSPVYDSLKPYMSREGA